MAFTQPCYELDAVSGRSAIYLVDPVNPLDRAPFLTPLAHLSRVLFHSDLQYLEVAYDRTVSVPLPALPAKSSVPAAPTVTVLPSHGLGFVPFCQPSVKIGSAAFENLMPNHPVQTVANSQRLLSIAIDSAKASLILYTEKAYDDVVPALALQVRLVILKPATNVLADAFIIDAGAKRIMFGRGRLDNQGSQRIYLAKAGGSFKIPKLGGSMDVGGGGLRIVSSNGTVRDYNLYASGYRGSGFDRLGIA
jgi:hypothetical protein